MWFHRMFLKLVLHDEVLSTPSFHILVVQLLFFQPRFLWHRMYISILLSLEEALQHEECLSLSFFGWCISLSWCITSINSIPSLHLQHLFWPLLTSFLYNSHTFSLPYSWKDWTGIRWQFFSLFLSVKLICCISFVFIPSSWCSVLSEFPSTFKVTYSPFYWLPLQANVPSLSTPYPSFCSCLPSSPSSHVHSALQVSLRQRSKE